MTNLTEIETFAKDYAAARTVLSDRITHLQDELDRTKRRKLLGIKSAVAIVAQKHSELKAAINAAPELFTKPRTVITHGVKVGFAKSKGKVSWEDADTVVKLIRRHHSDEAEVLIKTKYTPIKKSLENLTGAQLQKLGVKLEEGGDYVVIKPTDSEIDKLVDALLDEAESLEAV